MKNKRYCFLPFEGKYVICPLGCLGCLFTSLHHLAVHLLGCHIYQDPTCLDDWGLSKHFLEWWLKEHKGIDNVTTEFYYSLERIVSKMYQTPFISAGIIQINGLKKLFKSRWHFEQAHPALFDIFMLVETGTVIEPVSPKKIQYFYDPILGEQVVALHKNFQDRPGLNANMRCLAAGGVNKALKFESFKNWLRLE